MIPALSPTSAVKTYVIVGLAIALALSMAGNAYLVDLYLGERDAKVTAGVERDQVKEVAGACTSSVDAMQKAARQQTAVAVAAIAAAKTAGAPRKAAADAILSTPPSTPGDDCKSAQERADRWLTRRLEQ